MSMERGTLDSSVVWHIFVSVMSINKERQSVCLPVIPCKELERDVAGLGLA